MCVIERVAEWMGGQVVIVRAVDEQRDMERWGPDINVSHTSARPFRNAVTLPATRPPRHRVGPFEAHCALPPSRYNRFHS